MIKEYQNYFFVGIAGTGMSAIAQYLKGIGRNVSGSDRLFTEGSKLLIKEQFEKMGITCFFQDASGISKDIDVLVVSTAIEESNIEYQKALKFGIPIMKRSALLAAISESKRTIAVGGTSGKSTTSAMIFHIMEYCGLRPSLMTGAGLTSIQEKGLPGNAWVGASDWLVIEADESDGSIVNYKPEISLLLNIDRDHKEFDELLSLFNTFKENTSGAFIVNASHALASSLSRKKENDFGCNDNAGYRVNGFFQNGYKIEFTLNAVLFNIPLIGRHNMENAAAAVAACAAAGISVEKSAEALKSFEGIYRRMQVVGEANGVIVIDDFAHNPAEVVAAILACRSIGKKVFAWFQPHGFGPLRFMHQELIDLLAANLRVQDTFILSDVYYAGGNVDKDISPLIVSDALVKLQKNAGFIAQRNNLIGFLNLLVEPGDVILLMGARDTTLADFAQRVFSGIRK